MRRFLVCIGLVLTLASAAPAADVRVTPVRITLSSGAPIASMHIENNGSEDMLMQLQVLNWSQRDNADVLEPTTDVIANPPQFRLAAGGDQIVRFGLQVQAGSEEKSYRVLIDQVPREQDAKANQVRTVLRISIPIFIPCEGALPRPQWSIGAATGQTPVLRLTNAGNAHLEVDSVALREAKGTLLGKLGRPAYVLPGQTHTWTLTGIAPLHSGQSVKIEAETDWQPIVETVTVAGGAYAAGAP